MEQINEFLLSELRYLRDRSDKQVESIAGLQQNVNDIEAKCGTIESQLQKLLHIAGGAVLAGAGSGPLFQMFMTQ